MAATTGIIGGEIVLLGLIALPQMLRLGYDRNLAIGIICAGGSLGTMIPPSIVLIFYGLTANVSIGELFIAVVMPGLLLAGIYHLVYTLVRCGLRPGARPAAAAAERAMPLRAKFRLLKGLVLPMGIAFGVLGAIYGGIAAVTEAAGGRRRRQPLRRCAARHAELAACCASRPADHGHLRPAALADLGRHA